MNPKSSNKHSTHQFEAQNIDGEDYDNSQFKQELERYDPHNVADLMYARKERKIPGSVLKAHNPYCHLVQSNTLNLQVK